MRSIVALALLLPFLIGVVVCFVPQEQIGRMEERLHYSMGVASECRLFSLCEEGNDVVSDAAIEFSEEKTESVFACKAGRETFLFEKDEIDLSASIASKIPTDGEVDYRAFAFEDRLPELLAPLTDDEIVYVFARIVSSAAEKTPIDGSLTEITFEKEECVLRAFARITLGLNRLVETCHIVGLPEYAVFSISMTFCLENSHISVDSDKTTVRCETMDIPEAVLLFGCNLVFGKKDYRELFGNAVKNVFVNARIYL